MNLLRDWWRGYSDADLQAILLRMTGPQRPGAIVLCTARELRALNAWIGSNYGGNYAHT